MSEDPKPNATPDTTPAPATPTPPVAPSAAAPQTPDPKPQTPSATPAPASPPEAKASPPKALATGGAIDYAMPERKSFIPSPALIKNLGCLFKLMVGFTVLLCMGYFALVALNPKARQWATSGAKDGSGGPTPFKAVNQILAIPAQAIGKTDDVVQANNARVGQLDGLVAEEEAKGKGGKTGSSRPVVDPFASPAAPTDKKNAARAAGAAEVTDGSPAAVSAATMLALAEKRAATSPPLPPAPQTPDPKPKTPPPDPGPQSPDEMKLPGDIVIAHASPAGAPRASAAFFFAVVKLTISGITQSKPARLLINNRLTYEGDEINKQLGIVFVQLDPANKLLVFRDSTGAVVTRSY